ncbi:MAG: small multi-drug export protein [Lachnospiraceae bacterium]|nr:small multi-drug export protein [Lachnospiraceae bacterium]
MAALAGIPSKELVVFLISMLPVLELRGGLLAAAWMGLPLERAAAACIAGCLLPVPFILLLIRRILRWMKGFALTKRLAERLEKHALEKSDEIRRYEFWGLVIFVGIPLPGTGAWTGSLIAALLGIRFSKAMLAVSIGILLSAAVMSGLSYGILDLFW